MFNRWWNGSDLLGWLIPIFILLVLSATSGVIYGIIHFVTKYWQSIKMLPEDIYKEFSRWVDNMITVWESIPKGDVIEQRIRLAKIDTLEFAKRNLERICK